MRECNGSLASTTFTSSEFKKVLIARELIQQTADKMRAALRVTVATKCYGRARKRGAIVAVGLSCRFGDCRGFAQSFGHKFVDRHQIVDIGDGGCMGDRLRKSVHEDGEIRDKNFEFTR